MVRFYYPLCRLHEASIIAREWIPAGVGRGLQNRLRLLTGPGGFDSYPFPPRDDKLMIELPFPVVLASASPRRKDLLGRLFPNFEILPADLDEDALTQPVPWQTARDLAHAKALKIAELRPGSLVIAGDTVVAVPVRGGYEQLSKPVDRSDAARMLSKLSGIQHLVITGVCLKWPDGEKSFEVTSGVTFRTLTDVEIQEYVGTGESLDKAGAYAAQGKGASFIQSIDGSLTNVIGLPMEKLKEELEQVAGVRAP